MVFEPHWQLSLMTNPVIKLITQLVTLNLVCSCVWGQSAEVPASVARQFPNVILLIADDLGYGELGCQGNPQIPTPHIDALAESGVRCTQAYVTAPNCSPSRAGIMTGRTPTRFGYEFNPIGARNEDQGTGLPTDQVTIAKHLHAAGYTTSLIGKWHLGGAANYHPLRHGFDEFFGFLHEGHFFVPPPWTEVTSMLRRRGLPGGVGERIQVSSNLFYSSHMGHNEPPYDANNPVLRGGTPILETEYLTDAFTREAIDFIRRTREVPFFLCLTYSAVHSPLQAKQDTLAQFADIEDLQRRIFAAMLSDLDTSVGAITGELEQLALRDNTLIFFLSDNGGPTRELTSSNLPLRDGKGSMYEGGLRVPFIVNWPGQLPAGGQCEEVISSMDIFPTLAAATGTRAPPALDGFNILPLLQDADSGSPHPRLYWRQGNRAALRQGPWKIVSSQRAGSLREWELYHVETDISESRNLATEYPQILRELQQVWEQLDREMSEPLF